MYLGLPLSNHKFPSKLLIVKGFFLSFLQVGDSLVMMFVCLYTYQKKMFVCLYILFSTCSGDELLCTHPSSPLSLLTSGFGIEVSESLQELNASDSILKLSGYVSGPCDGFGIKVEDLTD